MDADIVRAALGFVDRYDKGDLQQCLEVIAPLVSVESGTPDKQLAKCAIAVTLFGLDPEKAQMLLNAAAFGLVVAKRCYINQRANGVKASVN